MSTSSTPAMSSVAGSAPLLLRWEPLMLLPRTVIDATRRLSVPN